MIVKAIPYLRRVEPINQNSVPFRVAGLAEMVQLEELRFSRQRSPKPIMIKQIAIASHSLSRTPSAGISISIPGFSRSASRSTIRSWVDVRAEKANKQFFGAFLYEVNSV